MYFEGSRLMSDLIEKVFIKPLNPHDRSKLRDKCHGLIPWFCGIKFVQLDDEDQRTPGNFSETDDSARSLPDGHRRLNLQDRSHTNHCQPPGTER